MIKVLRGHVKFLIDFNKNYTLPAFYTICEYHIKYIYYDFLQCTHFPLYIFMFEDKQDKLLFKIIPGDFEYNNQNSGF
jgi:hypothetical protein